LGSGEESEQDYDLKNQASKHKRKKRKHMKKSTMKSSYTASGTNYT